MSFPEHIYLHGLNLLPQFGPKRLGLLLGHFGNAEAAFQANVEALMEAQIDQEIAEKFLAFRDSIDLEQEQKKLEEHEIRVLTQDSEEYPSLLLEIPQSPPLLYIRGKLDPGALCMSVVGARMASNYGKSAVDTIVKPISQAGLTLVSGLAYGIDALAHQVAVDLERPTIAVLGCGLDNRTLYPKEHLRLAEQILACGGALLSEYPPGTPALKQHFVARNRIVSGISSALLVVECTTKSGALITAKYALDQNRQVFAVPGHIYSELSEGPNNLIKMGAAVATKSEDILSVFNLEHESTPATNRPELGEIELTILGHLDYEPKHVDAVISSSKLPAAQVSSTLTFLELKGWARSLGAGQYVKVG